MNRKKLIIAVSVTLLTLAIIGIFFVQGASSNIFEKNTTVGDFTVSQGEEVTTRNGATLTSTGNMVINGTLSCEDGPLSLVVKGSLHVSGTLRCKVPDNISKNLLEIGLQIVATNIVFEESATIETNGHIIIAYEHGKLPNSKEAMGALYDETAANTGDGARVGPFTDKRQVSNLSQITKREEVFLAQTKSSEGYSLINIALATDGEVSTGARLELRGTWSIGEKDLTERRIDKPQFLIDMGRESNVTIEDLLIHGASGVDGGNDMGSTCEARGGNGGDAFHFRIKGGHVTLNGGTIELGDGGNGGDAETALDCENGNARGGNGGEAGNMKITAAQDITIMAFQIDPGISGNGGNARAVARNGKNSCPSQNGGNAEAIGGNAGENKKDLMTEGNVMGIQYTKIARVVGGGGGNAYAKPGDGGMSESCECAPGNGGSGKAVGGNGGSVTVSIPKSTGEARGGDGGDAETMGGSGGNGSQCPSNGQGASGGNGGNAISIGGLPGKGTTASGNPGRIKSGGGGDGGRGGDGCPPGTGGKGGTGTPIGIHGAEGGTTCVADTQISTSTIPQRPTTIRAIIYKTKYLPLDQLIITNEPGCGEEHWRAERGSVQATDGTIVPDADVVCGYGKISENKLVLTTIKPPEVDIDEFASTTKIFKVER